MLGKYTKKGPGLPPSITFKNKAGKQFVLKRKPSVEIKAAPKNVDRFTKRKNVA